MTEPLLKCESVSKHFGKLKAVDEVSFQMNEGETLGLIGPNGAGKTTLYNCINGIYKPTSGNIIWKEEVITGLNPHQICKRGISRSFQVPRPFKNLSVFDNVLTAGLHSGDDLSVEEAKEKTKRVLKDLGMWERRTAVASEFSVPNMKALELARARVQEPDLLLLDEVAAGLNPKEVSEALELVKKIRDGGIHVFIVEHVMQAIKELCDRVMVLDGGKIIAKGTPKEISQDEEVIKAYLGERYAEALA